MRTCDVTEVDVRERVTVDTAQQHIVLVPVGKAQHEARAEGADGTVVQRGRVAELTCTSITGGGAGGGGRERA